MSSPESSLSYHQNYGVSVFFRIFRTLPGTGGQIEWSIFISHVILDNFGPGVKDSLGDDPNLTSVRQSESMMIRDLRPPLMS